jgi:hypothetical protein
MNWLKLPERKEYTGLELSTGIYETSTATTPTEEAPTTPT